MDTLHIILAGLYGISELLSLIPSIKANGTFQLIYNIITKIKDDL